jgi:hypothetical protein
MAEFWNPAGCRHFGGVRWHRQGYRLGDRAPRRPHLGMAGGSSGGGCWLWRACRVGVCADTCAPAVAAARRRGWRRSSVVVAGPFRHLAAAQGLFPGARRQRLGELLPTPVDHVFCASDLITGFPVYVTTWDGGLLWRLTGDIGVIGGLPETSGQLWRARHFRLAEVVRASAGFPGIPPLRLRVGGRRRPGHNASNLRGRQAEDRDVGGQWPGAVAWLAGRVARVRALDRAWCGPVASRVEPGGDLGEGLSQPAGQG